MSGADDRVREVLDELAFDHATGKLSDDDYHALRARVEAGVARTASAVAPDGGADAAEALVARARARLATCPACGPRPEPDPAYCSSCGRILAPCAACGERQHPAGATWCRACGALLRSAA